MYKNLNSSIPRPPTKVKNITKFDELPKLGGLTVCFMAPWDSTCQETCKINDAESVLEECKHIQYFNVNSDVSYELFDKFKIESIPTLMSIVNGVELHRINFTDTYKYLGKTYKNSEGLFPIQTFGY